MDLLRRALVAALFTIAVLPAAAAAAPGDLVQLAGPDRCVSSSGTGGLCEQSGAMGQPTSMALSPDGTSAYVAGWASDGIAMLSRDPASGALQPAGCLTDGPVTGCTEARAIAGANDVVVSPDGRHAYVASYGSGAVAIFDRDAGTGALTQKAGLTGCINEDGSDSCTNGEEIDGGEGIAISPDGKNVYLAGSARDRVSVLARDTTTGELTQAGCISETGGACTDGRALAYVLDVVVSPDGKQVYTASNTSSGVAVLDRDPATGALTQRSSAGGCILNVGNGVDCADGAGLNGPREVAISPDGKNLYVASHTPGGVAILDRTADGSLTQRAGAAGCFNDAGNAGCGLGRALAGGAGVAVSRDGASVYVASYIDNAVAVFDRDGTGGLAQKAGTAGCTSDDGTGGVCVDGVALSQATSLEVSPDDGSVYVIGRGDNAVASFARDEGGAVADTGPGAGGGAGGGGGGASVVPLPVPPPPPPGPVPPPGATPKDPPLVGSIRTRPDGTQIVTFNAPGPGQITIVGTAPRPGQNRPRAAATIRVFRAIKRVRRRGTVRVTLKPTRAARRLLKRRALRTRLRTTFRPVRGAPVRSTRTVTVRLKRKRA